MFPELNQRAPNYWHTQLQEYIDFGVNQVAGDVAGLVTSLGDLASDLDSTNSDVDDLTASLGGVSIVVTDDYASITTPDPWTLYIEVPEIPEAP